MSTWARRLFLGLKASCHVLCCLLLCCPLCMGLRPSEVGVEPSVLVLWQSSPPRTAGCMQQANLTRLLLLLLLAGCALTLLLRTATAGWCCCCSLGLGVLMARPRSPTADRLRGTGSIATCAAAVAEANGLLFCRRMIGPAAVDVGLSGCSAAPASARAAISRRCFY